MGKKTALIDKSKKGTEKTPLYTYVEQGHKVHL